MVGSVAEERHLWLNLTEIREKEKVFLLDAPISQSGLFGEVVSSVMEKFCSAKTQSAALKQFMPWRMRDHSTPSSLSREQSLPRKEPSGRSCAQAAHPPLTMVWGARGQPFPHQRPRRRVDLKRPSRPAASAPPSRSWPSSRDEESFFIATRRDQTAKAYLPASNTLSSLRSVTPTPQGLVCRKVQHNFSSVWQLGDALGLPPLPSVLLPPADHVLGDTIGSLLQRTDTVPAIFQSSASLSIIPKKDGTQGMDRRVPYLAHKLPGTHSCLPGFDAFSPRSWEASYISQNGQYGGKVPHKPSRGFMVAHPGQACTASSPLIPGQVPFLKGSSRSGNIEPCGQFSDETETQAGRVDVEPSNGNPNLESVWRSGSGPLCFSRVVPMPALVLPKFPDDSGHRYIRPFVAECKSVRVSASKADSSSPMQSEGEQCPSPSHSPILALPDLVLRANSPPVSAPLGDSKQAGPAVPASGQDLASSARDLEAVGMAHTGPRALMNNLPVEVQETIASARAPATRKLYSSKWGVFESWCFARAIDPVNCPVGPVLEFLQERLTTGADATTLRVYVAAIAARRELDEVPLGRHQMVSTFMHGVRRLRPVRPMAVPSWDLSVVLEGLVAAPFEPLESASERILTLKFTLLLVFTSLKRVGDLQALSVSEMCMDFAPGLVKVTLRPRPGYIPKVLSTSYRSQVVTLHSFHPPPFASSEDEKLTMLCPVRALKLYVDRSKV